MPRRILLACGVVSSLLYVAADVLAALCYPDYHSFSSRFISELLARGAPTKHLVDPLFLLHGVFVIALGAGVWMSARDNRALQVTAGLLIALGVLDLPGPVFFAMNVRGSGATGQDILHIAVTAVTVLLILSMMGVAAFACGPRFRVYSFATFAVVLAFGVLTSFDARHMAAGEPTPWGGITERINIGAYLLWQAVLAISLLRHPSAVRPAAALSPPTSGPLAV